MAVVGGDAPAEAVGTARETGTKWDHELVPPYARRPCEHGSAGGVRHCCVPGRNVDAIVELDANRLRRLIEDRSARGECPDQRRMGRSNRRGDERGHGEDDDGAPHGGEGTAAEFREARC